ncbi:hypothetical protein SDRG_08050 [Saprolegnia diclina VS20]|uniref:Uncharacterized protein n=1 Tax=Saprolegnia diclina (strain VS20) TaxID=1156394 RepID=T0RV61_SAPDV|nr:hypothetical protein SDRG_08050 [Saprolegnia diclina VS20]EQC34277.1 hypothetical protein SDRG_08050 [Saprolegnia diclina VS20]|eukprot:XP_008612139.1 hypothetical protein SDRG_08050 [Saprolegnia diclina VS20]
MYKLYNASTATTNVSPTYARRVILTELTSIEYAVPQLRAVSVAWSMRMNVQHCWLDFNQTFEIAHTEGRQQRCKDQFATNGAVYLEAILRNVVWADYMAMWGGVNSRFAVTYGLALQETAPGQRFLDIVSQARATTTVLDELAYWRSYKLNRFQLQWQNRWQSGITESVALQNALGLTQFVTIKNFPQGTGPWTTFALYWMPLNDLTLGKYMNRSFVHGSSRYYATNLSATLPPRDLEVIHGITKVSGQFFNQTKLFRTVVGPFLSVDCLYPSVPTSLTQAYLAARALLLASFGGVDGIRKALPTAALSLTPLTWRANDAFYGGNPMCTLLPRTAYVQQSFDFFDDCAKAKPLTLTLDPLLLVLARAVNNNAAIPDVCAVTSPATACVAAVTAADQLLESFALDWNTSVANEIGLNIGLMQYATAANGSWVVLQQPLLEPSFAFFGYVFLFDWVLGNREVVSFQGDSGNLTLMSNVYSPQLYTTGTQPLQSATQILYYLVVATSVILVGVGGIALMYAVKTRLRFNGLNLFFFNRIVGAVWIGRPLAFLRGASAILLLSSANASLETSSSGASRFVATPRSWLEAIVVTGEATWLTYVANDILVLLTRDHTKLTRAPLAGTLAVQAAYYNITPLDISYPVPGAWLALPYPASYGGSPLCPDITASRLMTAGLFAIVSYDAICLSASGTTARIQPTRQHYVLSALMAQLDSSTNMTRVCAHDVAYVLQCAVYLRSTVSYINSYVPQSEAVRASILDIRDTVRALDISFLLFFRDNATTPVLQLQSRKLLDPSESNFEFFAWLYLYDWVLGIREVISFQGDTASLTLITDYQPPLSQATQAWQVPSNIARYLRAGVLYVTGVMMAIAGLATVYIMISHGALEGWNMLELGRVGGIVWVGRPFLLLRSVTAMVVLSTATLQLQNSGYLSYFVTVRDPWYKTLLAANEVTWLITIVNDILLVFTGQYATHYAMLNGLLVWVAAALLTNLAPVTATTSIDLACVSEQVDAQAACTSGSIQIGSLLRMAILVGTVLGSHGICYLVVKCGVRTTTSVPMASLFLTSGAKFLFEQTHWTYKNVYYLDRSSAVLVGLLTLRVGANMVVLDIKIWRLFVLPLRNDGSTPLALRAGIPLLDAL